MPCATSRGAAAPGRGPASISASVRGAEPADKLALAELSAALSTCRHTDVIDEIDLNPVIVNAQGRGLSIADADRQRPPGEVI